MTQIPDRVLSWLWSVLQPYSQPQPAYSDAVAALVAYPSIQPRTEVYTFESGQSALLLCLAGTLPVNFRGSVYRFPLEIWLPETYGVRGSGVMAYVKPNSGRAGVAGDMIVRPGQHVGVDGRIYHPYLKDWGVRERSNIVDFLRILQDVFAKEPPVISKQQQQQYRSPHQTQPRPAPPPKETPASVQPVGMPAPGAPPRPPKSGEQDLPASAGRDGPPLPPLPNEHARSGHQTTQQDQRNGSFATPPRQSSLSYSQRSISVSNGGPPPLPPLPPHVQQQQQYLLGQPNANRSPVSPLTPTSYAEHAGPRYQAPPPLPGSPAQIGRPQQRQQYSAHDTQQGQQQYRVQIDHQQQTRQHETQRGPVQPYPPVAHPDPHAQHYGHAHPFAKGAQPAVHSAAPPPDLLTDPFDITLPTTTAAPTAAPPIPPNPEKEHLLHALSTTLAAQAHNKLQQNQSALSPLLAQNAALQDAHARLTTELSQLQALDKALSTNEAILRRSLHDCDAVLEASKSTAAPNIDDVLVAPTVAAQQLWSLCADEAAIREALWCLQRAVGAGRVGGTEFVRLTRGLAREAFLKMALARKVARGLGLEVGARGGGFAGA